MYKTIGKGNSVSSLSCKKKQSTTQLDNSNLVGTYVEFVYFSMFGFLGTKPFLSPLWGCNFLIHTCSKKSKRPCLTKWWQSLQAYAGTNALLVLLEASSALVNLLAFPTVLNALLIWVWLSWNAFSLWIKCPEYHGIGWLSLLSHFITCTLLLLHFAC